HRTDRRSARAGLHGFPDPAHLPIPAPRTRGRRFRSVAPWMRGHAPTDVPADCDYGGGPLAADACTLHEALAGDEHPVQLGYDRAMLGTNETSPRFATQTEAAARRSRPCPTAATVTDRRPTRITPTPRPSDRRARESRSSHGVVHRWYIAEKSGQGAGCPC